MSSTPENELIARFVDDRDALAADELATLVAQLQAAPAAVEDLRTLLVVDELLTRQLGPRRRDLAGEVEQRLRDAKVGPAAVARRQAAILRKARTLNGTATRRAPVAPTLRVRSLRVLAAAAGLALAVAGGLWFYQRLAGAPALGLRLVEMQGAVAVMRAGNAVPVSKGLALQAGDRVTVPEGGKAALTYDGEQTRVELQAAAATFRAEKGAKRVRLDAGLLRCAAAPQRQPFRLETPQAVAEVVGTRFWLDVAQAETALAVQEGKVALRQKDKSLEVNAGETAVADGSGMKKLSAEDAWVKDLLARAEAGPWDAVDFAQGTIRGDAGAWRLDRRGEPAGWRLWQTEPRATSVLLFEGAKWKRGVIVGRVMILPDEKLPVALAVPPEATAGSWPSKAGAADALGDLANGIYLAFYQYAGPQKRGQGNVSVAGTLTADQHPRGVWYRFVLYFDTAPVPETDAVVILGLRPENRGVQPAEVWGRPAREYFKHLTAEEVGIGLMAKGVPALWQGVKLVPLGPDLPPPPAAVGRKSKIQ